MTLRVESFDLDAMTVAELHRRKSVKWQAHGSDVLPAWVAEMDFPLAAPVAEELHAAIDRSDIGYRDRGRLPEAMAGFWSRRWGMGLDPARVQLVADVMTGIEQALLAFTAPGSGVVITPPVYPPFFAAPRGVGRVAVEVPMITVDTDPTWDLNGLEAAFSRADVSAFLMSNPHNPTGSVAGLELLRAIADLAAQHDVCVIVDEIHAPLVLPGAAHVPYFSVVDDDANAVVVTSASKTWNIAGLKCAQMVGTARTNARIQRLPMEVQFGVGHLGVLGSTAAYDHGEPWLDDVLVVLDENRRLIDTCLERDLPGARWVPPAATYLGWIDLRSAGAGDDPAAVLLERGRVALSSGPTFGVAGRGFARLNFGTSPAIVSEILERMASVFQ